MNKKLSVDEILTIIEDEKAIITYEQVIQVFDDYENLTESQRKSIESYCKRVPFSHPRWTLPPAVTVTGYSPSTLKEREAAKRQLDEIIKQHQAKKKQYKEGK